MNEKQDNKLTWCDEVFFWCVIVLAGLGAAFSANFLLSFLPSQPTPATLEIQVPPGTEIYDNVVNGKKIEGIETRLDALDGGQTKTWSCGISCLDTKGQIGNLCVAQIGKTYPIQTIGKETPAQQGFSNCVEVTNQQN